MLYLFKLVNLNDYGSVIQTHIHITHQIPHTPTYKVALKLLPIICYFNIVRCCYYLYYQYMVYSIHPHYHMKKSQLPHTRTHTRKHTQTHAPTRTRTHSLKQKSTTHTPTLSCVTKACMMLNGASSVERQAYDRMAYVGEYSHVWKPWPWNNRCNCG